MNKLAEICVSYTNTNTEKIKINSVQKAYNHILDFWDMGTIELQEEFKILILNRANVVLGIYPMSKGGISGTVVDLKLIFGVVLKCNASGIIVVHNHPSGNLNPSEADKLITKKIKSAANIFDIQLIDHLIITKEGYYSFSNEGCLF